MAMSALELEPVGLARTPALAAPPKILIADDDPGTLRLLADRCGRLGFEVDTAANGVQTILKATRIKPALVMIDVNMPEVDGLSVCAHLLDPGRPPIDIIVITGSKNRETLERCEGFGARYIRKGPEFWNELEATLAELYPRMAERIVQQHTMSEPPNLRKRPNLLLVDDDEQINRYLATRLDKCGLDMKYASDARLGFRMACKDEPAVIITDYFMPDGDAEFLLRRLRSTPETEKIPVIVLTGRPLHVATEQNLRREFHGNPGAAEIIRKSEDIEPLFNALKKYCGFERWKDE